MKKSGMILKITLLAMICFLGAGMETKASSDRTPLYDGVSPFDGTSGFPGLTRPWEIVGYTGYISSENFDYVRYADDYPDLKKEYGYDRVALFEQYACEGRDEGRIGRIDPERIITESYFDYKRYANDYPDLKAAFGYDKHALYTHYITTGQAEGRMGYSEDEEINAQRDAYQILQTITNDSMTEYEKVKAVHDWICVNTAYDYENYLKGTLPLSSQTISGLLGTHKGICHSYARSFETFMMLLGIDVRYVSGETPVGSHAWNRVKVDGIWYSIDVTWDDPVPDKPGVVRSYKYFLISDEQMAQDHVATMES